MGVLDILGLYPVATASLFHGHEKKTRITTCLAPSLSGIFFPAIRIFSQFWSWAFILSNIHVSMSDWHDWQAVKSVAHMQRNVCFLSTTAFLSL